ncbi:WD40-repeat-containing domain protein [Zopfochytrium polystomum]|nr:WD40-repeat-containing domain protein [Zopfochytrium polystomum]
MCVASDVKSLARLSRASKLWSLRTSHDTIWQPMFLARWAAPVSLAKSPNILDRGQAMTINATEAAREIEGRSNGGVSIAEIPWKTLFRDRSALASFQRFAKASKLNDKHSSTVRCICIDAYSIVTAADDGVKIWDRATRNCVRTLDASHGVQSVACHRSTIVCGTLHGEIKAWNAKTGALDFALRGLSDFVYFVHINRELIIGAAEDRVNVWSRLSKTIARTFRKAKGARGSVDVSNGLIVLRISDTAVQVLSLHSGDVVYTQELETMIMWIQLENSILTVGGQYGIGAWDIRSCKHLFGESRRSQLVILSLHSGILLAKSKTTTGNLTSMKIHDLSRCGQILRTLPPQKFGDFFSGLCLHASGVVAGLSTGEVLMLDFDWGIPYAHEFMELRR